MLAKNSLPIACVVALTLAAPAPTFAQTAVVNSGAIAAACATSAAACEAAILAAIAALQQAGLTPAALNEQLGIIAGVALNAARALPPSELAALSGTVSRLAAASTDPAQQTALLQLSQAIATGGSPDLALAAFAAAISAN